VKELTEWWREIDGANRQWLILGKGPSFEERGGHDLRPYTTLAINHVVREMPVDVTSVVNYEVLDDCSEEIDRNSRYVLMPRYPHTVPGDAPFLLESYFDRYPVLEKLSREGRLVWYNLSSDTLAPGSPVVVENGSFSVCILFNLLGALGGGRGVRTLGVDGGVSYGTSFRDLSDKTRLANGMATYDYQWRDMMRSVKRYRLRYSPLNRDPRLRWALRWELFRQYTRTSPRRTLRRWLGKEKETGT
jgi:hypothetical protein